MKKLADSTSPSSPSPDTKGAAIEPHDPEVWNRTVQIRAADLYLLAASARVRLMFGDVRTESDRDRKRLLEQAIDKAQAALGEAGIDFRSDI